MITQDFVGCYGLYLFKKGDYFAISNSLLRLVEHVGKAHKLTLNRDYASAFIPEGLCSVAYSDTMINEIQMLDRSAIVDIDIRKRRFVIRYFDYMENTVELDTAEGMRILDNWYSKWAEFIRNLTGRATNIHFDLSGGFDSRLTLCLLLGSGVDIDRVRVFSYNDDLHTHAEDFEIATLISEHFKFKLNNNKYIACDYFSYPMDDIVDISFYAKLGFHKQMRYSYSYHGNPYHCFGGSGGECIRDYWHMSGAEYINNAVKRCAGYSSSPARIREYQRATERVVHSSFAGIREKFERFGRDISDEELPMHLYRETRCRNHFGKNIVESYLGGDRRYMPLLDPDLHKLKLNTSSCPDKNLLMAVIFTRYSSALADFKFEGGRSIAAETIEYARRLNDKYPYAPKERVDDLGEISVRKSTYHGIAVKSAELEAHIAEILRAPEVRNTFTELYDEEAYDFLCDFIKRQKYQPLSTAYTIIAISKFANHAERDGRASLAVRRLGDWIAALRRHIR